MADEQVSQDQQAPSQITLPAQTSDNSDGSQPPQAPSGGSRLAAVLSAVAKTVTTGLSGIPESQRPSFVTGLGEGARASQAAEARQQAIKFKSFDDQVRLAELHHQDQKMQLDTQAQQDAHTKAEIDNRALANEYGIDYDTISNHGPAVLDHLTAQTAANGAASVPPGTHVSADGDNIYVPKDPDSQKTRDGQKQMYSALAPALGLPSLPPGAAFVPPRLMNMFTNKVHGFGLDGKPISHDELPGMLGATQAQRDSLAKSGASDAQLKTLDNMIGIYKANLDALDKHAAGVKAQNKQAELAAENSPEAVAGAAKKEAAKKQAELNVTNSPANQEAAAQGAAKKAAAEQTAKDAGSTKMFVGSDKQGNQIAGTHDELTAAGAQGLTKLDDDTGKKVITARQLISPEGLFSLIRKDMESLDAKGKMGSSAEARFHDALLEKAGSDPDYAPLITHTHLLATALMQAHVGSKGSENMMDEFKKLANAGKMSAPTLRSALGAEYNYVHEKAMLPKKEAK